MCVSYSTQVNEMHTLSHFFCCFSQFLQKLACDRTKHFADDYINSLRPQAKWEDFERLQPAAQTFVLMPLMHSEDIPRHEVCCGTVDSA